MKRYTLAVTSPEYWSEIHDALIVDSNQDGIPDRKITCSDCKHHSPTRGTYELTEEEATEIGNHPHVKWIELSPIDNPGYYPNPHPATKRFSKDVKIYRDLSTPDNAPPSSPTSAEINRTNWAMKRVGIDTNGDSWPNITGNPAAINSNIDFSLTGKNVDLIIHDSGIQQYHPEFIDGNGQSRVSDIVLDGPYTIDPAYFNSNSLTYTKTDGRVGIATTAAHEWWENTSKRSGSFSSVGTVAIPNAYTMNNAMGIGGTESGLTSGHGTGCAGLAAGNNFGLAFEANIWNMPGIGDAVSLGIEANYDLIKIFHQNKPTNSLTGRKNPTVVNGSWGYQAAFSSGNTVSYKFQGSTGTFTGNASVSDQVTAMKAGLNNQVLGAYRSWSTSSRSNSIDTAASEMMATGVIYVAAAGNNNQRLGVGANDVDRLNYMSDNYYGTTDPRSEFPSGTVPCNHRDWMNPQGIGFDSATDFHPVICVGAMEEYVATGSLPYSGSTALAETKASYSNNGPGIDVWAPADETLSAGTNGVASYEDFPRVDDGINYTSSTTGSDYFDTNFNGTSAAAPVVTGLIALYLETNPSATSRQVKDFLFEQGSVVVADALYADQYSDDSQTTYWTGSYNMRGAQKRILRDKTASPTEPSVKGVFGGENIITSGLVLNLDANNYSSGTTWTDTSGQGNNGTLVGGTGYSSDNGGYLIFDGTDDKVTISAGSDFAYGTGDFTIEIWCNVTGTTPQDYGEKLFTQTVGGQNYFKLGTSDGSPVVKQFFFKYGTGGGTRVRSGFEYTVDTWHHFVVTRNGTTLTQYVDNDLKQTTTGVSFNFNNTTYNPTIGAFTHTNSNNFDGKIAQVRVYKGRGFSASDVQNNFDAMKGRYLDQPLTLSGVSITQS